MSQIKHKIALTFAALLFSGSVDALLPPLYQSIDELQSLLQPGPAQFDIELLSK